MPAPGKTLVPLKQAAENYSVSIDTLRRRISAGDLTGYRLGSRVLRVDLAEVDQLFFPTTQKAG